MRDWTMRDSILNVIAGLLFFAVAAMLVMLVITVLQIIGTAGWAVFLFGVLFLTAYMIGDIIRH